MHASVAVGRSSAYCVSDAMSMYRSDENRSATANVGTGPDDYIGLDGDTDLDDDASLARCSFAVVIARVAAPIK